MWKLKVSSPIPKLPRNIPWKMVQSSSKSRKIFPTIPENYKTVNFGSAKWLMILVIIWDVWKLIDPSPETSNSHTPTDSTIYLILYLKNFGEILQIEEKKKFWKSFTNPNWFDFTFVVKQFERVFQFFVQIKVIKEIQRTVVGFKGVSYYYAFKLVFNGHSPHAIILQKPKTSNITHSVLSDL